MARQDDMQAPSRRSVPLTYEDYLNFPNDGRRHELVDGEHFVTPSPVRRHQDLSARLEFALALHLRDHPLGEMYHAPFDVILSDTDVVEPDILFVSRERAGIVRDWVHGAPDLVVEILSPATRTVDETIKRRLYDRAGVREYWIVDPELELVRVFRRAEDGAFPRVAELSRESAGVLGTPLLPGLAVPLTELFR